MPRIVHSPIPDDDGPIDDVPPEPESETNVEPEAETIIDDKARKKGRGRPPKKKEDSTIPKTSSSSSPQRPVLTVIVPPLPAVVAGPVVVDTADPPADLDEPRYCYCNGVSAGTVRSP